MIPSSMKPIETLHPFTFWKTQMENWVLRCLRCRIEVNVFRWIRHQLLDSACCLAAYSHMLPRERVSMSMWFSHLFPLEGKWSRQKMMMTKRFPSVRELTRCDLTRIFAGSCRDCKGKLALSCKGPMWFNSINSTGSYWTQKSSWVKPLLDAFFPVSFRAYRHGRKRWSWIQKRDR